MINIDIRNAKKNLNKLVDEVNIGFNPITIVNKNGKNAVLISKEECNNIEETLYLSSINGLVEDINNIRNNENWSSSKEFKLDEEW